MNLPLIRLDLTVNPPSPKGGGFLRHCHPERQRRIYKILHFVLRIIIEKILHCVQNDKAVRKASLRSRRITKRCAKHRYARAE